MNLKETCKKQLAQDPKLINHCEYFRYIYSDDINMDSLDQACELCYVAKKYMLPQLLKTCMEFIWKDVDCETALRAYEFAKLFDDSGILEKSMKVIHLKYYVSTSNS